MSQENAKVVNHWGIWVNSEIPTTGVLSMNSINWEFLDLNDEICLTCEAIQACQLPEKTKESNNE